MLVDALVRLQGRHLVADCVVLLLRVVILVLRRIVVVARIQHDFRYLFSNKSENVLHCRIDEKQRQKCASACG